MRTTQPSPAERRSRLDTNLETEVLLVELERKTPAWRKLELVRSLNAMVLEFSLAGLRLRNPEANAEELKRLLADIVLGPEQAARVYGSLPDTIK
jgi:hypothetical protein